MKRLIVALGLTALLSGCSGPEYCIAFEAKVDNRSPLSLDAKIGPGEITTVQGEVSEYVGGTVVSFQYPTTSGTLYFTETGFPLTARGSISVSDGEQYTLTVWVDTLGGEFKYNWNED